MNINIGCLKNRPNFGFLIRNYHSIRRIFCMYTANVWSQKGKRHNFSYLIQWVHTKEFLLVSKKCISGAKNYLPMDWLWEKYFSQIFCKDTMNHKSVTVNFSIALLRWCISYCCHRKRTVQKWILLSLTFCVGTKKFLTSQKTCFWKVKLIPCF